MLTHCGNNVRNRYSGCVFSVKDIVPVPLKTSRNQKPAKETRFWRVVIRIYTGGRGEGGSPGRPGNEGHRMRVDIDPVERDRLLLSGHRRHDSSDMQGNDYMELTIRVVNNRRSSKPAFLTDIRRLSNSRMIPSSRLSRVPATKSGLFNKRAQKILKGELKDALLSLGKLFDCHICC